MRKDQRERLQAGGWQIGDASDFLGLSNEETQLVETRLVLAEGLRKRRERAGLTQVDLARRLGSSQSRIAKMEAADPSVSLDLLLRSLFRLGASRAAVARLFAQEQPRRAA
jgi:ribosome-binding protein aMBF1 (putative translation factor)